MSPYGERIHTGCGRLFWAATLDQDSPASKRAEQYETMSAAGAAEKYATDHGLCQGQKVVVGFARADGGVNPHGIHVFDVLPQTVRVVKSK